MEEEEMKLLEEEKILDDELNECKDKHKQVKLVYEKVVDSIKGICKLELNKKKIEEVQNSSINNSSNEHSRDLDVSQNVFKVVGPSEDEISKHFIDYLETTRGIIERLFLTIGKKEFQNMLKERKNKSENLNPGNPKAVAKASSKKNVVEAKTNTTNQNNNIQTNYEYNYSDEELKEDDKRVKDEYNSMANEFKKIV